MSGPSAWLTRLREVVILFWFDSGKDSVRDNICHNAAAPVMFSFSTCLCMSCATTEPDGEALGTLGFNVEVAKRMLNKGGFSKVEVLLEYDMTRWFEVAH